MSNYQNWEYADTDYEQYPGFYNGSEADDYDSAYESDDESFGESDDEDYSERSRRGGRPFSSSRRPNVRGASGRPFGRTPVSPYQGRGTINTPAGSAQVALPKDLVSKKEFQALEKKVLANNQAILKNGKGITGLNDNVKKLDRDLSARISDQAKRVADNKKAIGNAQQAQLFSAILPPKINNITFSEAPVVGAAVGASASFDMTTAMLPALLTGGMGTGSGSGASGQNDMMMPLVLLAASGALGGGNTSTSGSSDNTGLMLALVFMLMGNR